VKNGKLIKPILSAFFVLAMGGGMMALAASGYGSQSDPLVTLSYITDVAQPQMNATIDSIFSQKQATINQLIDSRINTLRGELSSGGSGAVSEQVIDQITKNVLNQIGAGSQAAWQVVTLPKGKTMLGGVGSEFILRNGSANCSASGTVGLLDLSNGEMLANGKALLPNHLYLSSIAGKGLTAVTEVTVLVKGGYTLS